MKKINPNYYLIILLIIAVLGMSIAIPAINYSKSYSEVRVEELWTPDVPSTSTQTLEPSLTYTPFLSPTTTRTAAPTLSTNCILPEAYWYEHPELWLDMLVGQTRYSKTEIQQIFEESSQDVYYVLFRQLYLANLNIFSGADPTIIEMILGEANAWLQLNKPGKRLSDQAKGIGSQLAVTLAEYNNGLIEPGFCPPYEAQTLTPTVVEITKTPSPTPTQTPSLTATRYWVTLNVSATPTSTNRPGDRATNTPRPTQANTSVPTATRTQPPPTQPPPTQPPTDAPPEDTPVPTRTPRPTDPATPVP